MQIKVNISQQSLHPTTTDVSSNGRPITTDVALELRFHNTTNTSLVYTDCPIRDIDIQVCHNPYRPQMKQTYCVELQVTVLTIACDFKLADGYMYEIF